MAQFIQKGDIIDYTNTTSSVIEYGDVVVGKDKVFVATEQIVSNGTGGVCIEGVFEMPAETTAAFVFGQKVYYDADNDVVTATASVTTGEGQDAVTTPNAEVGIVVLPKAQATATVLVKI